MLQVQNVSKSYGVEVVLDNVSFIVNPGDRAGLVGPNGCGKSTLLHIIAGEVAADSGQVSVGSGVTLGVTLGVLRQGLAPAPGQSVQQAVLAGIPGWPEARAALDAAAAALADPADLDAALAAYDRAQSAFDALGGYAFEHRVEALLDALGLAGLDPAAPADRLSGGEQTRVMLAGVLLAEPDLLLLDEPTNHLDVAALEWLEGFLSAYPGAALIVSHDRTFLDRTVNRILEIDGLAHTLREYVGGYAEYAAEKAADRDRQEAAWRDQQAEVRRMQADIHRTKMHAKSVELTTTPRTPGPRRYAKKVAKKALSREKKLDRYLDSDERVEKPRQGWGLNLEFGAMPRGGQEVLRLHGLGHRYPGGPWLFRDVTHTVTHGQRVVLLGGNGSGKSTLLEIAAGRLRAAEGRVALGAGVRLGYMPQQQDTLDPAATALDAVRRARPQSETDARNFLHHFLFAGDDVFVPVGSLSYGERARLLLARLVAEGANLLVLDEPLNHLDIASREHFEAALGAFPGTVLAVSHDRAFVQRFATVVWSLANGRLARYLPVASRM